MKKKKYVGHLSFDPYEEENAIIAKPFEDTNDVMFDLIFIRDNSKLTLTKLNHIKIYILYVGNRFVSKIFSPGAFSNYELNGEKLSIYDTDIFNMESGQVTVIAEVHTNDGAVLMSRPLIYSVTKTKSVSDTNVMAMQNVGYFESRVADIEKIL